MKIKTFDLIGRPLDWAVAKCEGINQNVPDNPVDRPMSYTYRPSTEWAQGGPIIEREGISVTQFGGAWKASTLRQPAVLGPTHLVAAMRVYVASKLGDEVEIPEGLTC